MAIMYLCAGIIDLDYLITSFVFYEGNTQHVWFVYALFLLYAWWWLMRRYHVNVKKVSWTMSAIVLMAIILFGVVLRGFGIEYVGGMTSLLISDLIYPFIGIPFFTIGYYLHMYKGLKVMSVPTMMCSAKMPCSFIAWAKRRAMRVAPIFLGCVLSSVQKRLAVQ